MKEQINNPDYYWLNGGLEAIEIIDALGLTRGFCLWNVIKYIIRAGKKSGEDEAATIAKANWYLEYYIYHLKKLEAENEQKNAQAELLVCKD